ncbi:hypothetical protein KSP40_PGU004766 [Platanthera guangdongensis]|uniref:PH domain-containing protein n=1 Tax=Platanthera guangdongensis TaxID=2320717 RepID=A0ABR2LPW6_9ASPA
MQFPNSTRIRTGIRLEICSRRRIAEKGSPEILSMASFWRAVLGSSTEPDVSADGVEFWSDPERGGWLTKQGEYIKTWRKRWFVLKQGKLFWFKDSCITRTSVPRGIIPVSSCLTVKGADDVLNRQFAFELSTPRDTMYFIADSEKEKEEWINSIGRSIVQHSRSITDREIVDYDSARQQKRPAGGNQN